jgi:hypothetical protein
VVLALDPERAAHEQQQADGTDPESGGTANDSATPAVTKTPPSGGPTNWLAVSSAAYRRPLARTRRSRGTTSGRIDCAEVSYMVSETPMSRATTYNSQIEAMPVAAATARATSSVARRTLAPTIALRRSSRSDIAPAGRANSSHGSVSANASPAIRVGDSVYRIATSGSATLRAPSARLEKAVDVQSQPYATPSRCVMDRESHID